MQLKTHQCHIKVYRSSKISWRLSCAPVLLSNLSPFQIYNIFCYSKLFSWSHLNLQNPCEYPWFLAPSNSQFIWRIYSSLFFCKLSWYCLFTCQKHQQTVTLSYLFSSTMILWKVPGKYVLDSICIFFNKIYKYSHGSSFSHNFCFCVMMHSYYSTGERLMILC